MLNSLKAVYPWKQIEIGQENFCKELGKDFLVLLPSAAAGALSASLISGNISSFIHTGELSVFSAAAAFVTGMGAVLVRDGITASRRREYEEAQREKFAAFMKSGQKFETVTFRWTLHL